MKLTIQDRSFRFSLKAIEQLNAILASDQVMPLTSKYDRTTEEYSDVDHPEGKRKIEVIQTTTWK